MSKRQAILDTAVALFVEQGVENTPTAQISKAAGVATGTLFHHFRNKDELVAALVLGISESMLASVQQQMAGVHGFRENIQAIWLGYIEWAIRHPTEFRFKTHIDSLVNLSEDLAREKEKAWEGMKAFLASGIESGIFKPFSQDFLFTLIESQLILAAQYFIEQPAAFKQKKQRQVIFTSLWDSLAA